MAEVKPGVQSSEYLVAKVGGIIAALAPIAAALLASRGYDISSEQIVSLGTASITAIAAIASAYAIGRSLVKAKR